MIRIERLTKRFGRAYAVRDASLTIDAGDSIALWGANGAGKTTLIRCVLGLLRFRGRVEVGGLNVRRNGKRARMLVGYVPQELGFHDDLGVAEALRFFARLRGLGRVDIDASLSRVGLAGEDRKRVRELSGGMKQRLALAIALLGDPPVLVLDEVTASLDAVGRRDLMGLLGTLRGSGRTVLFASHRIEEVRSLARRVATMDRGRITGILPVADFTGDQGRDAVLHLVMAPAVRARALSTLRDEGFTPRLNGVGLLVPVCQDRKAAPFRVLAEARLPVDDFEIVHAPEPGPDHHIGQEPTP